MSCVGFQMWNSDSQTNRGSLAAKHRFDSEELSSDRFEAESKSWMPTDQNVSGFPDVEEVATPYSITEARRKTWPLYWVVKSGDAYIMPSDHRKI